MFVILFFFTSSPENYYLGYKVHAMVTFEGYITASEITPASTDDREGLHDLVDGEVRTGGARG